MDLDDNMDENGADVDDDDDTDRMTAIRQSDSGRCAGTGNSLGCDAMADTQEVEVGQQHYKSEGALCQLAEKGGLTLKGEINMGGTMEITHHNFQDNRTINKEVHHHQGDLHQHAHHHHVREGDVIHHHGDVHQAHHVHYSDSETGFLQIKDQSELAMARDENVFVETWALRAALQQASDARPVILSGPAGSGKTCTAHALLRHYRGLGYTPLVLHRFEEWRAHVGGGRQLVVLLEDIFGREQLQSARFLDWVHVFPTIQQLSASGKCVIIITTRDTVLESIQAEHGSYSLLSHTLNLSSAEACLSEDEKKNILKNHLKQAEKSISDELFDEVGQSVKNVVLFPAQCKLFAESLLEGREALKVFTVGMEDIYSTCGTGPKVFLWISPDIIKKSLMKPMQKKGRWGHVFTNELGDIKKRFGDDDWTTKGIQQMERSAGTKSNDDSLSEHKNQELSPECTTDAEQSVSQLEAACRDGHSQLVQEMIGSQVDVSVSNKNGFTALHVAALAGQADIVEILLNCKCPVDAADREDWTPLHVACYGGHTEIAKLLIEYGAKLELATFHGMRPLHIACRYGHTDLVQLLLQNGAVTETKSNTGFQASPLHVAAFYNHIHLVQLLIKFKAQTTVTDRSGWLPLHYACQEGHLSIVEVLLSAVTAMPSLTPSQNHQLQINCPYGHTHLVRDLLQCGLCSHDAQGKTAICRSCYLSNKLALENLSCHQTYPDKSNSGAVTALFLAAQNGHGEVVNSLLKAGACAEVPRAFGWTPLLVASYKGHHHIIELLLQYKADVNGSLDDVLWTALHLASANGHREAVEVLLQNGAAPNARDNYGISPLHRACIYGHSNVLPSLLARVKDLYTDEESAGKLLSLASQKGPVEVISVLHEWIPNLFKITEKSAALHEACRYGNLEIVKTFLGQDFPVNTDCSTYPRKTPIHIASAYDHPLIVDALICHGAKVNEKNSDGDTALHLACQEICVGVVRVLLEKGCADTEIRNGVGDMCLHIAASRGSVDMVTLLLASNASVNVQDADGQTPLICGRRNIDVVDILLENKADASIKTSEGETVLHLVCTYGLEDSLLSLLRHKVDLETKDGSGETALLRACKSKRDKLNKVKLLLENEANVEATNDQGLTPVHLACQSGDKDLLQLLLQSGGLVNSCNTNGETPLHHACSQGHSHLIEVLLQAGVRVNECDHEGNTPLHKACVNLQTGTVRAMLKYGASINIQNKEGLSPMGSIPSINLSDTRISEEEKRDKLDKRTEIMLAFLEFNQRSVNKDSQAQDAIEKSSETLHHTDSANSSGMSQARDIKESIDLAAAGRMEENEGNENEEKSPKLKVEKKTDQDMESHTAGRSEPTANESDHAERGEGKGIDNAASGNTDRAAGNLQESKASSPISEHLVSGHVLTMTDNQDNGDYENLSRPASQVTEMAGTRRNQNDLSSKQELVNQQESSSFHQACFQGRADLVLHHLLASCDVDAISESGQSALHCACSAGQHDIAALLLQHGADPTLIDASGRTCLHEASFHGHLFTVDLLLTLGLDINATDTEGRTALHLASCQGHGLVTALLVSHGARIDQTDSHGNTPLMLACMGNRSEVCVVLLNSGAALGCRNHLGESVADAVKSRNFPELEKLIARHNLLRTRPEKQLRHDTWYQSRFLCMVLVISIFLAWATAVCLAGL